MESGVLTERRGYPDGALDRLRLRTDLITEASERLDGALHNVFEYELRGDDLYFQGQALEPIFNNGINVAEELARRHPDFAIELQRRYIERQQLREQIELRQHVDWCDPFVLVHISPTPDAVLSGEVNVNAYDIDRKTIMVRITEPTPDGVRVTSMSLDGNDRVALQAVGDFFDVSIPHNATSEDILAMHFVTTASHFADQRPSTVLRQRYDDAMQRQYGGEWYAGQCNARILDTMQTITAYPDLIERHVDEVVRIKDRYGGAFRSSAEYDKATYDFLAAIEQAMQLGEVVGSLRDAGDLARRTGKRYANTGCPTGVTMKAEQVLNVQGIGLLDQWHYGMCRACLTSGLVGSCSVCVSCERADNRGEDLDAIHEAALARRTIQQRVNTTARSRSERPKQRFDERAIQQSITSVFGRNAVGRYVTVVGDRVLRVVDRSTGQILEQRLDQARFALAA